MKLAEKDNSFEEVNRVRCFNHSIQLSARALLKPFNAGLGSEAVDDEANNSADGAEQFSTAEDDDDECPDLEDGERCEDVGEDEFEDVDNDEREKLLADTAVVRETVTKV